MARPPGREPDLAGQLWHYLATRAEIDPKLAKHVWRQLTRGRDTLALRFAFTTALQAGPPGSPERVQAAAHLIGGAGSPGAVVAALEELVKEKRLTRREATTVEDALLTLVTRNGTWK